MKHPKLRAASDMSLEDSILDYIHNHPGTDAELIAQEFNISIAKTIEITERLIIMGLIEQDNGNIL